MTDELDVPLGQERQGKAGRRVLPTFLPYAVAALLAGAVAGFAGWAIVMDDPLGGEPRAIVSLAPTPPPEEAAGPRAGVAERAATTQPPEAAPAQTVTIIDGMSGKRQQVTLAGQAQSGAPPAAGSGEAIITPGAPVAPAAIQPPPASAGASAAPFAAQPAVAAPTIAASAAGKPDASKPAVAGPSAASPVKPQPGLAKSGGAAQRLAETSPHGAIPKIGADGKRPLDAYASPLAAPAAAQGGPQVAIVVGRLGISAAGTEDALAKLPAAVTVAFAPYGATVEALVARARAEGREVLLQVPMEPFDYPDNDPGPQTLLTSLSADRNIDRLHWFMSRFAGYVGIGNYMGARFAANEPAVSAVMREVAKRGLLYFDDGTASRSLVGQVASVSNVPFARADIIVDAVRTPAEIDAALARLEARARERGSAVGAAIALPASIEHIAKWAAGAASRGITLVPISVIANKAKSS